MCESPNPTQRALPQVIMQAQREPPPSMTDVKDKFLVQYCTVGSDVREVAADIFDGSRSKDVKQTKLRVLLVRPCYALSRPRLHGAICRGEVAGRRANMIRPTLAPCGQGRLRFQPHLDQLEELQAAFIYRRLAPSWESVDAIHLCKLGAKGFIPAYTTQRYGAVSWERPMRQTTDSVAKLALKLRGNY